jgi:hypothetical protein
MLCHTLQKRLPERISAVLGIPRPHVYRYLQRNGKKRRVPSAETTAKIIDALRGRGYNQTVLPILKTAFDRMQTATMTYQKWIKETEKANDLFSDSEYHRLQRSLRPDLMHY